MKTDTPELVAVEPLRYSWGLEVSSCLCMWVCVPETVLVWEMKREWDFFYMHVFDPVCRSMSLAAVTCDQANTHQQDIFGMFLVTVMVNQKRLFHPSSSFDVTQDTVFPSLPQPLPWRLLFSAFKCSVYYYSPKKWRLDTHALCLPCTLLGLTMNLNDCIVIRSFTLIYT